MSRERPEESVPRPLRRSRALAVAALLLLLTAFWLPWWGVSYADAAGFEYAGSNHRVFEAEPPATTAWGPHVTGTLAVAAGAWLFVRIAGRSHAYEPAAWRRDLRLQTILVAASWASTLLWPADVPSFWGGRTFQVEGGAFTEAAAPGLGWFLALLAAVLLGVAWRQARPGPERSTDSR